MRSPAIRRLSAWPGGRLRDLADRHGTPLYVVDLERIRQNYDRLSRAFDDAEIHYAAKANTAGAVLRTLHAEGAGIECASGGEVYRALRAGVPGRRVLYTAVNPPAADLEYAVGIDDITITAGAEDTVARLASLGFDGRLCVRVNPGVGAGHHEHVATGADAKFGVPADRAVVLLEAAASDGFDVVGLHAHAGSGIATDQLDAHRSLCARLGELARASPVPLEFVDVGGGFGVPYRPNEPPLDIAAVARETRAALGDLDARLAVEPGRYLVADAGVLLTRVNTIKEAPETIVVGVDAGMNTLLRPALYGAYHHVRNLAPGAEERALRTVTVSGPVCESADVLAADRDLPDPRRGDLLAVGNAGAYGETMENQYNSRPRAATVAIDGDRTGLLRERESFDDLVGREVEWP